MKRTNGEFAFGIIGVLGLLLIPISIWKCGWIIPSSYSMSVYLGNKEFFNVILGGLGITLISNKGFSSTDHRINILSGLSAIGVISFPCLDYTILHYISAISLFTSFFIMCMFIFVQERSSLCTERKIQRNKIYKTCAWVILIGFIVAIFQKWFGETIMLSAYGFAYLVQSKVFRKLNG